MKNSLRPFYVGALAVMGLGLAGTSFVPRANADSWNKMTVVTVNEPIIAGNKVLEPGTYVWKLLDSQSDRHIVQIFDKDQRHLEETILAIPNYRLSPTGKTRFAFWETPAGVPKAVRAWFFPGDNFGQEFAYPTKLIAELASAQPTPVAYHEPAPAALEPAPVMQPEPQPVPAAPVARPLPEPTPAPAPAAEPAAVPQTLPHTASQSPLIALLGLTSLSAAGLLLMSRKRSS